MIDLNFLDDDFEAAPVATTATRVTDRTEVIRDTPAIADDWHESLDDWIADRTPKAASACPVCHHEKLWRSIYGDHWICGVCHPPATPEAVAEWYETVDDTKTGSNTSYRHGEETTEAIDDAGPA